MTPDQSSYIPRILDGKDALVRARSSPDTTIGFLIPSIEVSLIKLMKIICTWFTTAIPFPQIFSNIRQKILRIPYLFL